MAGPSCWLQWGPERRELTRDSSPRASDTTMLSIATTRGLFQVVDVYYARPHELETIGDKLRLNQIVYLRQMAIRVDGSQFAIRHRESRTSLLDLKRERDALFGDLSSTARRQVRKMDRMRERLTVRRNDAEAYRDFLTIYNEFVMLKRHSEKLSERRLEALKPAVDVFVAYMDGRPLCGHVFVRDTILKRVGLLFSASTRLAGEDAPIVVGSLNRWLHWYEIELYKAEGMLIYDFGGIGTDSPQKAEIARFKLSFGGASVVEHNYMLTRAVGRAAINVFYAMRRMCSTE